MTKLTKAQKRLEAAKRARAALGMEEDDASRGDRVPQPSEPAVSKPVLRGPADRTGLATKDRHASKRRVPAFDAVEPPGLERSDLPRPGHDTAQADARKAGLSQVTDAKGTVDAKHWPKKHAAGSLVRGTSVWYRGERFYVEFAPAAWANGCYARITQHRINPDKNVRSGTELAFVNDKGVGAGCPWPSFCVHADLLSLAPVVQNMYANQPTMAGVARKERAAKGERDVGDPVAVQLRECKTLEDTYRVGADFLGVPEAELKAKYGHLNAGQQRMNIGNRMRGKWKKEQRGG